MAKGKPFERLIAFESGHYKKVSGVWKGDSVWAHFIKPDGGMIHVNKDKVEYMETFGGGNVESKKDDPIGSDPIGSMTARMAHLEEQKMEAEIELIKAEAEKVRRKK